METDPARQEITSPRTERDGLTSASQRRLGQRLDHVDAGDPACRINELTQRNEQLIAERGALERERPD